MMILGIYFTRNHLRLQIKKQGVVAIAGMLWVFAVCNVVKHFVIENILILIFAIGISMIGYGGIILISYRNNIRNYKR